MNTDAFRRFVSSYVGFAFAITLLLCISTAERKPAKAAPPKWEDVEQIVAIFEGDIWIEVQQVPNGWSGLILAMLIDKRDSSYIDGDSAVIGPIIISKDVREERISLMDYGIRALEISELTSADGSTTLQNVLVQPELKVVNPSPPPRSRRRP